MQKGFIKKQSMHTMFTRGSFRVDMLPFPLHVYKQNVYCSICNTLLVQTTFPENKTDKNIATTYCRLIQALKA